MAFGTRFGSFISNDDLRQLELIASRHNSFQRQLDIISATNSKTIDLEELIKLLKYGKSQLGQDAFALIATGFKSNGFFCEFGASDGLSNSNTFVLEKHFGWHGILAEPNPDFHASLAKNRSCLIDTRAVWEKDDAEVEIVRARELSTIRGFEATDQHYNDRSRFINQTTKVKTVTLQRLLHHWNAPSHVDFLSIDTEGSELKIIEQFDFSGFSFGAICIEHNFRPEIRRITSLLEAAGYCRVLEKLSDFDAWFVPRSSADLLANFMM